VGRSDVLRQGKHLVGVEAKRGQMPLAALHPGDRVQVVTTPGKGDTATDAGAKGKDDALPEAIEATVAGVGPADASGTVVVNLAVAQTDGLALATRAATGNVALVLEPRG
jgi:hypothetical protein